MPRTRSLAWSQLKLGIVVVAALAIAVFFAFMVGGEGGLPWQRYHLKTRFPNVQGLSPARSSASPASRSARSARSQFVGAQVEVTLELSEDVQDKITEQSRAMIGSISLLGETAIDINAVGIGRPLPDWGYIQSARTPGADRRGRRAGQRRHRRDHQPAEGHPGRQGHGRQAVHRRTGLPGVRRADRRRRPGRPEPQSRPGHAGQAAERRGRLPLAAGVARRPGDDDPPHQRRRGQPGPAAEGRRSSPSRCRRRPATSIRSPAGWSTRRRHAPASC